MEPSANGNIDDRASDALGALNGGEPAELFGYEKVKGLSQTVEHARQEWGETMHREVPERGSIALNC